MGIPRLLDVGCKEEFLYFHGLYYFLLVEFSKMKEELPESYKSKGEDTSSGNAGSSGEASVDMGEGKTKPEEKPATTESNSPSEGNVTTAAAAALASAAVKAKVRGVSCADGERKMSVLLSLSTWPMWRSARSSPWWHCWWKLR